MSISFTKILSKQGGVFSVNQNVLSHIVPQSVADFQDYSKSYYNHFPQIATTTYRLTTTGGTATPANPQKGATLIDADSAGCVEPVVYGWDNFDYNTAALIRHSKWISGKKGELSYEACRNHFSNTLDKLIMDVDEKKQMSFFGSGGADASYQSVVKRSPFVKLTNESLTSGSVPAGSYQVPCVQVPLNKVFSLGECDMVDSDEMGDIELYTELENIKNCFSAKPAFSYHSVNFGTADANQNGVRDVLIWGSKMPATFTNGTPAVVNPPAAAVQATLAVTRPKAYIQANDATTASPFPFAGATGVVASTASQLVSNKAQSALVHYTDANGVEQSKLVNYNSVTVANNSVVATLVLTAVTDADLAAATNIYVIPVLNPIHNTGADILLQVPCDYGQIPTDTNTPVKGLKYNCPFYQGQSLTIFGGNRINTFKILGITMADRAAAATLAGKMDRCVDEYTISLDSVIGFKKFDNNATALGNTLCSMMLSYPLFVDYAWTLTKAELVLCGVNSPRKAEVKSKLALCDKFYKTLELEQYTNANPSQYFRRNFEIRGNILGTYLLTPSADSLISTVSNVVSHRVNINSLPTTNRDIPFGLLGTNSIYVDKLQQTLNNSGLPLKRVQNFNDTTDNQEQQDTTKQIAVFGQVINNVEVMDPAKPDGIKQLEYQLNSSSTIPTPVYYLFKHTVKAF
jgi:hypothetical protein